jgi:hypothetical protein
MVQRFRTFIRSILVKRARVAKMSISPRSLSSIAVIMLMAPPLLGQEQAVAPAELTRIVQVLQLEHHWNLLEAIGPEHTLTGPSVGDAFLLGPWQVYGFHPTFLSDFSDIELNRTLIFHLRKTCYDCELLMNPMGFEAILSQPTETIVKRAQSDPNFAKLLQLLEALTARLQGRVRL